MNWSPKIMSVRGINIKVHGTFLLILIWAAYYWSSSTGQGIFGALFGVVATLLLFASVTLHELGHSFQAMKLGVRVRDITLMPMGGLARMEEIPEDPQKELRIALAGPLVNFGIGVLLIAAGFLLDARALVSLEELQASLGQASWSGMLAYLTSANLALGLFNLVPAYPMDGGRILRALLAKKVSYAKATKIATQVGQGFALLFGLYGILSGSWTLLLIAAFVWMGANQENQGTQVKYTLAGTKVNQAMTRSPHTLQSSDTLARAIELTLSTSQSDFPVLETGSRRVVGLLSEHDLLRGLQTLSVDVPVQQAMRKTDASVRPDELLHTVQQKMLQWRIRAVPVVNEAGELQGLLTANDVNEAYRLMATTSPALSTSSR